jgi:predicted RNase H-like nuclease (RuvC/YqgF family)
MSDTTISDSTPHNVADLGMLCRRLERELNAANADVERLTKSNLQLREGCEELQQRIKRLEAAGDRAIENSYYPDRVKVWTEAKEAKP